MPYKAFSYYDEDDNRITLSLPATWEDCSFCDGTGKTLRGGLAGAVFTAEDINEDPEFFEDMANGAFDVPCDKCKGSGAMKAYDLDEIDVHIRVRIYERDREEAEMAYEREMWRRLEESMYRSY